MIKRILVCGDAMTDLYWHGTVSRLSPEAPVPVVAVSKIEQRQGGAANVANNIEAMGAQVERIFGRGETIQKIRLFAKQHIARVDFDRPQEPILPDIAFLDALDRCQIVVFVDYGKGSLARIKTLLEACTRAGVIALIDPKGHDYGKYRGASLIKPNQDEMRELVGGWGTQEELDRKVRQVLQVSGIGSILLTQAANGMTLYNPEPLHLESENKEPVDVSGAGEAALSAFAVALAKGHPPQECARYASRAAGLAIAQPGTVVLTEEQVFGTI